MLVKSSCTWSAWFRYKYHAHLMTENFEKSWHLCLTIKLLVCTSVSKLGRTLFHLCEEAHASNSLCWNVVDMPIMRGKALRANPSVMAASQDVDPTAKAPTFENGSLRRCH